MFTARQSAGEILPAPAPVEIYQGLCNWPRIHLLKYDLQYLLKLRNASTNIWCAHTGMADRCPVRILESVSTLDLGDSSRVT